MRRNNFYYKNYFAPQNDSLRITQICTNKSLVEIRAIRDWFSILKTVNKQIFNISIL